MSKFKWVILFLFSVSYLSCTDNEDVSQEEISTSLDAVALYDVSYGSNSQQIYDLYLPKDRNTTETKVIMIIHGGAWTEGDKEDMNGFVTYLQSAHPKYAIVNVNYVLANETQKAFPYQFEDIESIIQKLTSEKEELHINPEFGIIGTSAGGHIGMMYDYIYDTDNQVKFVGNIVGPTDFTDPFYETQFPIDLIIQSLVDENAYPEGTNFKEELSPIFHVSTTSSPTCSFFGNEDPLVPEENGEALKLKLDQFGIDNSLRIYEGGHGDNWTTEAIVELQYILSQYILLYLD